MISWKRMYGENFCNVTRPPIRNDVMPAGILKAYILNDDDCINLVRNLIVVSGVPYTAFVGIASVRGKMLK